MINRERLRLPCASVSSAANTTTPDSTGRRATYRLCDSVNGVNWCPTLFLDEQTLSRYTCIVCHVTHGTAIVLPCSHALSQKWLTGCVVPDGGSVCPLYTEPTVSEPLREYSSWGGSFLPMRRIT
ncbi:hypothetical protein MRX96_016175 [Rhipicephalus microplus]